MNWLEQGITWFNSAMQSGMLALGGIGIGGIFTGAKAWLSNLGVTSKVNSLQATVLTQEQLIKDSNDRIRLLENHLGTMNKGLEATFIAINKLAQSASIPVGVKNELIDLSAATLPLFKTQEQVQQQLNQLGQSITNPLSAAQQQLDEQKLALQNQATAKVEETTNILQATFGKIAQSAKDGIDSVSKAVIGDKQA